MSNNRYEVTVDINASAEKIYGYVADLQKHLEWSHALQKMTVLTPEPARVGSIYQTEETLAGTLPLGRRIMFKMMMPFMGLLYKVKPYTVAEITELKANERVKWSAHVPTKKEGKKFMQMHWEIELEPDGNGATKVTQRCHLDPPADSPAYSMTQSMVELNRAETASNLMNLKSMLEA